MKIYLAIDGSPCSDGAVSSVATRLMPPGTEIRLVTVVPPVDPGLFQGTSPTLFDEIMQQQQAEAARRLTVATTTIRKSAPDVTIHTALLQGRPKEAIVDDAERWGADLIVVGSHGYGTLKRMFLGSVSLAVATNANCSVEIVRCPLPADQKETGPNG